MVSKLTVKLIAAASSLALLAGGDNVARAKTTATHLDPDRIETFESGVLMQVFLAQSGTRDPLSAELAATALVSGLSLQDFYRLVELTRDLRGAHLPEDVETAAVGALIDGIRRESGHTLTADEAADITAQVFDAHIAPIEVVGADEAGAFASAASNRSAIQVAASGDTTVGSTDIVEREARGILGETIRELVIQDNVFFSEVVETGPDSALRITLLDKTTLTLGPSSRVVLDEFVYDPDTKDGLLVMRLIRGAFRFTSGLMPKSRYSIDTPVGDIGIRGTVLDLWVFCEGGPVDTETRDAAGIGQLCRLTVDVEEGAGTLNHPSGETDMNQGERLVASNDASERPDVNEIPPNQPTLPQIVDMRQRVLNATIELLEGELPGGSISNADDEDLQQALRGLLRDNENIADLLTEAVGVLAPARLNEVLGEVAITAPEQSERVAQSATDSALEGSLLGQVQANPPSQLTNDSAESDQSPPALFERPGR